MEIVPGEPLRWGGLNVRGVAKSSNVGHVKGYILEMVQDKASGTIRIPWYHFVPFRVTPNKGFVPPVWGNRIYL